MSESQTIRFATAGGIGPYQFSQARPAAESPAAPADRPRRALFRLAARRPAGRRGLPRRIGAGRWSRRPRRRAAAVSSSKWWPMSGARCRRRRGVHAGAGVVAVLAVEQGLRGDQDADLRAHPADGGQVAVGQRAAGQVDEGVGAALARGAQIVRGRVVSSARRTPPAPPRRPPDPAGPGPPPCRRTLGQGQLPLLEQLHRLRPVRIHVVTDPVTHQLQLGHGHLGGGVGQDLVGRRTASTPTCLASSRDPVDVFGRHVTPPGRLAPPRAGPATAAPA